MPDSPADNREDDSSDDPGEDSSDSPGEPSSDILTHSSISESDYAYKTLL